MLVTTLEQERKKIYQQGEAAGIAKGEAAGIAKGEAAGIAKGEAAGMAKGRIETQQQMIGQLLQFRFELTEAEHGQFVQQVASIQDLQQLDALANLLLNKAAGFEDFVELLKKSLPADKTEA